MKQISLVFCCIWSLSLQAQNNPCMRVNGDYNATCPTLAQEATAVNSGSNVVNLRVDHTANVLDNVPNARFKGFWMFGDGNFRHFPYGTLTQDESTYWRTYVYPAVGTYSPTVVLAERKSNTTPPRRPRRTVNVLGLNTAATLPDPLDAFQPQIPANSALNIFNHDWNRPHYPTVFAISSLAQDELVDSIFFFYNAQKKNGAVSKAIIHERIDFVEFPNYFPVGPVPVEKSTSAMPSSLSLVSRELSPKFYNYLAVGLNGVSSGKKGTEKDYARSSATSRPPPNNYSELRFFPALVSKWDQSWISGQDTVLPVGHYLALAIGSEPLPRFPNPNNQAQINPVFAEVLQYFPNLNNSNLQIGPDKYVRGIATKDVDMVASIDPNGLEILQVCPDGANRYKVKIRMEICNEGYMHAKDFTFKLIDLTNGLIGEPDFVAGTPPNFLMDSTYFWKYQWNVFLDGVHLPDASTQARAEQLKLCDTAIFVVTTNWLGVQRLAQGQGLELCVQFLHAREECTKNYTMDERQLSPIVGYACGELSASSGWWCCIPVYITLVLAIIILILVAWIAWFLKKKLG